MNSHDHCKFMTADVKSNGKNKIRMELLDLSGDMVFTKEMTLAAGVRKEDLTNIWFRKINNHLRKTLDPRASLVVCNEAEIIEKLQCIMSMIVND